LADSNRLPRFVEQFQHLSLIGSGIVARNDIFS
jgi:hypothetical protein